MEGCSIWSSLFCLPETGYSSGVIINLISKYLPETGCSSGAKEWLRRSILFLATTCFEILFPAPEEPPDSSNDMFPICSRLRRSRLLQQTFNKSYTYPKHYKLLFYIWTPKALNYIYVPDSNSPYRLQSAIHCLFVAVYIQSVISPAKYIRNIDRESYRWKNRQTAAFRKCIYQ